MYRRWYDQEVTCSKLLGQVRAMPQPEMREFCARIILNLADKLRRAIQKKGANTLGVSSIGIPAIASLYHFGSRKRRWYDQDPVLHKAVATFYTLPVEGLAVLGFKLGDTFGLLQVYAQVCDQVEQKPDLKAMTRICSTSLRSGKDEAREVLIEIVGKDLYESLITE